MITNFASSTLVVLGAVITILGFILAGNMLVVVTGLAAVFAGGLLSVLASRQRVP